MREVIVAVPLGYANALMNGCRALVLYENRPNRAVHALVVSGPDTGRVWIFSDDHVTDVPDEAVCPYCGGETMCWCMTPCETCGRPTRNGTQECNACGAGKVA
jgi:hypothetical protein